MTAEEMVEMIKLDERDYGCGDDRPTYYRSSMPLAIWNILCPGASSECTWVKFATRERAKEAMLAACSLYLEQLNHVKNVRARTKEAILQNPTTYLMLGDLDKDFHKCECECAACEGWREDNGRPTHAEIREMQRKVSQKEKHRG